VNGLIRINVSAPTSTEPKRTVKIARPDLHFASLCSLRGQGGTRLGSRPPVARGPGVPGGFGARWASGPGAPIPNQFRCAGRPLAERTAGRPYKSDVSTRHGRPGKPCLNHDLMQYLGPCRGITICKFQVKGVGGLQGWLLPPLPSPPIK